MSRPAVWIALCLSIGRVAAAETFTVRTQSEFASIARTSKPGDTIALANGEWRDFEILFAANGTAAKPVTLTAQTPGKVTISGKSNLRLSGDHLVVSGLVFRDGYSPTSEVISFRRDRDTRANFSRVTGVVIDRFNKSQRLDSDNWVAMYGHHNRFDHNHIEGKTNAGATLVVVRDEKQGLANFHRIDHNYFGPRPNLGMNGGETIRVGTSHDSLSDSHTVVDHNWFEHCDGEVEIVSNKSGANVYRGNLFFESRGALVLRHGDGNLVEDNVFLGGGKPHTGGIRVINRRQTIRNNYMEGLSGEGFASALTVMYGVPNSPLNRYVQVTDTTLTNNTIIDSRSIFLGAGKDQERSAPPLRSSMRRTLIVNRDGQDPLRIEGDITGLRLQRNVISGLSAPHRQGLRIAAVTLTRGQGGLWTTAGLRNVGVRRDLRPLQREETGVSWYAARKSPVSDSGGTESQVAPDGDELARAILDSLPGDRLRLAAGEYHIDRVLQIVHAIELSGPPEGVASLSFSRPTLFEIGPGASLYLSRLRIDGRDAPDNANNAVIRSRAGPGAASYSLRLEDCDISNLTTNRFFHVFSAAKGTLAEIVAFNRVTVSRVSGDVIAAAAESDDLGYYGIERLEIRNSRFVDVAGMAVDLYRGGNDESTFGPSFVLSGSELLHVGTALSMRLHGVQLVDIHGNDVEDSGRIQIVNTVGEPTLRLDQAARSIASVSPESSR